MSSRRPSLPPMPDLSHLSEDERKIIEDVLKRQREEEEKEQEVIRQMQDDFETYQQSVKKLTEETRKIPLQDEGAVCQICHKTKFADGVGHSCYYCHLKSCARCGGRMALRSNKPGVFAAGASTTAEPKIIWACNLCRKKQELLAKTGAWYHGGMARPVALDVGDIASGSDAVSTKTDVSPPNEKKPKMLQQQDSSQGSEKENIENRDSKSSFSRTGSLQGRELKRQYSMSDALTEKKSDVSITHSQAGPGSSSDNRIISEQEKLREHGQIDRGRGKERTPARHRYHSESRISETDRKYRDGYADNHHGERDRHGDRGQRSREVSSDRAVTGQRGKEHREPAERKGERHRDGRELVSQSSHDRRMDRQEEREMERRRDSTKDRRKEGQPERYRQSPVNGRREYSEKDYRGSREPDVREMQDVRDGRAVDVRDARGVEGEDMRVERRNSSRHHRDRSVKDQRRSPSRERGDRYKELEIENFKDAQVPRHRILIDHASDTQLTAAEDSPDRFFDKKQHLDPSSAASRTARNNRKKTGKYVTK